MKFKEVEVDAIPRASPTIAELVVKPHFQSISFGCKHCGHLLVIGYKSIWEADPDRTGDVAFRCSECKNVFPMILTYRSARANALFVPIIDARFTTNRKKLTLGEFNEQINNKEGVK